MNGLKWISLLTVTFGIIFIIYGWTQSWDSVALSTENQSVLIERTVRTYVFILGGIILISIGISVQVIKEYIRKVESNIIELHLKENKK